MISIVRCDRHGPPNEKLVLMVRAAAAHSTILGWVKHENHQLGIHAARTWEPSRTPRRWADAFRAGRRWPPRRLDRPTGPRAACPSPRPPGSTPNHLVTTAPP